MVYKGIFEVNIAKKLQRRKPCYGTTLLEMVLALTMVAVILAAIVPQFRVIQNSWDSKQGSAETLQNGRVLTDHLYRNLATAVRITAVSDSTETNGYIEFEDNDGNTMRYDIGAGNYVEFGEAGSLSDLAGLVSKLQFTCYDGDDFDTPITDVNSIRFVKVETTLTNPAAMGPDKTFASQAYLCTSSWDGSLSIYKEPNSPIEFDGILGASPALSQIDTTHYLCAYEGPSLDGWANILTVDTDNWTITAGTALEYDTVVLCIKHKLYA